MKALLFIFLLISTMMFPQKLRVIYEFTYVKDTMDRNTPSKELMALEIQKSKSLFYSYNQLRGDSIYAEDKDFSKYDGGQIKHTIEKKLEKGEILFSDKIGAMEYSYKDLESQQWKIEPTISKVLGYNVQLATTNYRGRRWQAWFTMEIPINDGPYKFFNLPGLILSLEDDKQNFIYKAIAIQKNFTSRNDIPKATLTDKKIYTTREKFLKEIEKNRLDPAKDFKRAVYNNEIFLGDKDPQKAIKEFEEKIMANIKKDNNPIER